jgi:hypothetical protein
MQIHELNRKRPTNEGVLGAIGTALGQAVSPVATQASSAGILVPDQKLAAVMKNPAMVKLATQYADEWVKSQPSQAPAVTTAPATTAPAPAGETPEQKRIRLQKAAQQNIDKTAVSTPQAPTQPAAQTPADIRKAKQTQAGQAAQSQMAPFSNLPADQAATQAANIRKAKQAQAAQAAQNQMAVKEDTAVATPGTYNKKTGAAKLGGKTMTALSDLPPNVQQQIQAKQDLEQQTGRANPYMTPAAQQPEPAAKTTAPAPATAQGFNAGNVNKLPGMGQQKPAPAPAAKTANFAGPAGYSSTTTSTQPGTTTQPSAKTAPAQQQSPAAQSPDYIKNFLQFANQKTAMRDSTTYRTLGLADAEKSKLKPQLDAAKQKVIGAQGNPAATKEAVKNYILTAMAALQLVASENKVAASSTQAPAYGQQGNAQSNATNPAAGQTNATNQSQPIDVNALMKAAGLAPDALTKAGPIIQKATGNGNLSATGDDAIDGMLQLMGYNVS